MGLGKTNVTGEIQSHRHKLFPDCLGLELRLYDIAQGHRAGPPRSDFNVDRHTSIQSTTPPLRSELEAGFQPTRTGPSKTHDLALALEPHGVNEAVGVLSPSSCVHPRNLMKLPKFLSTLVNDRDADVPPRPKSQAGFRPPRSTPPTLQRRKSDGKRSR